MTEDKLRTARLLLSRHVPVREINRTLKTLYGTGCSPSDLARLREDLEIAKSEPAPDKFAIHLHVDGTWNWV